MPKRALQQACPGWIGSIRQLYASPVMRTTSGKWVAGLAVALLVFVIAFAVQTCWLFAFGRVVASTSVEQDSVRHSVVLRERCIIGDWTDCIGGALDRLVPIGRTSEYEYWIEVRRAGHLVAASEREGWDSMHYDHPRIDSADAEGVTVSLDPNQNYSTTYRFDLHPIPSQP